MSLAAMNWAQFCPLFSTSLWKCKREPNMPRVSTGGILWGRLLFREHLKGFQMFFVSPPPKKIEPPFIILHLTGVILKDQH